MEPESNGRLDLRIRSLRSVQVPLRAIHDLSSIKELILCQNYLKKIEPILERCTNLILLDLSINLIEKIENLPNLASLTHLILSNNLIEEISGLEKLQSLLLLDLSGNAIKKLQNLSLPQLETLRIYANKIQHLSCLDKLESLRVLEINKNEIKDIKYLSTISLPYLELLDVSTNNITDLDSTQVVVYSLKSLKVFNAYNNPVEADFRYKFRICKNPTIESLDGQQVTAAVRKNFEAMLQSYEIETLIEGTSKEYEKRVELEKARKDFILKSIEQQEANVRKKFEAYRDDMNKELGEFIEYVNYVKRKKDAGEEIEINEEFLRNWEEKLKLYEAQRIAEEEKTKKDIDAKYNSLVLKKLVGTTYSDKLYQISMSKPEIWQELKRKEYESRIEEEKADAHEQIQDKYKLLNQSLRDEHYLNDIINRGQSEVLRSMQTEFKHSSLNKDKTMPLRQDGLGEILEEPLYENPGSAIGKAPLRHGTNPS